MDPEGLGGFEVLRPHQGCSESQIQELERSRESDCNSAQTAPGQNPPPEIISDESNCDIQPGGSGGSSRIPISSTRQTAPGMQDIPGEPIHAETSNLTPQLIANYRKGPWSLAEDNFLNLLVQTQGAMNWVRISQSLGSRTPKQCRERYHQVLKTSLNHEPITAEEGLEIERLVSQIGKRWNEIAGRLSGRSENAVKNWWNGGQTRRKRHDKFRVEDMESDDYPHPFYPRPSFGQDHGLQVTNLNRLEHREVFPTIQSILTDQNVRQSEEFTDSGYASRPPQKIPARTELLPAEHVPEPKGQPAGQPARPTLQDNDARSVYTDVSAMLGNDVDLYLAEFANQLYRDVCKGFDGSSLTEISNVLPDVLKEFAIRIGYQAPSALHCDIMYFVHRFRSQICRTMMEQHGMDLEPADECETTPKGTDGMSLGEKIVFWYSLAGVPDPDRENQEEYIDLAEFLETEIPQFSRFYETLVASPAYAWLVSTLRNKLSFTATAPDQALCIRRGVLEHVNLPKYIRRNPVRESCNARFMLDVDPLRFLRDQEYKEGPKEVITQMIVITGSEGNVYATTCAEYMKAVWPQTGSRVLELVGQALESPINMAEECQLSDQTILSVRMTESKLMVHAAGSGYALAEIAEQLAWLGAALMAYRTPYPRRPVYCYPVLQECTSRLGGSQRESGANNVYIDCHIGFEFEGVDAILPKTDEPRCWYNLFGNPVIVMGYPIPRRSIPDTGLEISLEMMTTLARARRITTWDNRPFIKGHSTMLVPTGNGGGIVLWHLFFKEEGDYISYEDPQVRQAQASFTGSHFRLADLAKMRHVVGWCTNVKNWTGSSESNYDIAWSGLRPPPPGSVLEKVEIQAGQFITANVACVIGKKDRALHISNWGDDYIGMVDTISKRFVLLYDVDDKRAWLVDGASAVLHLLRASIRYYQNDRRFRDHFLLNPDHITADKCATGGLDDAFKVLTDKDNQLLALYNKVQEEWEEETIAEAGVRERVKKSKSTYFRFRDRVDQICDILSQMLAHQDDMHPDGVGFRLKLSPRRRLEGFDFMDVATNEGRLEPKLTQLASVGAGWVDFVRALHAIPFFGSGFGQLIQPHQNPSSCRNCTLNVPVPVNKDYLAVCVADLENVIRKRGSRRQSPWRVIDDIYWHAPDHMFEPCQCKPCSRTRRDRVQVLLPASFPNVWGLRSPAKLVAEGAVLFGHSFKFPLRWKKGREAPEPGEPDDEVEDELRLTDSGIGSSLGSSADAQVLEPSSCTSTPQEEEPMPTGGDSSEASPVLHSGGSRTPAAPITELHSQPAMEPLSPHIVESGSEGQSSRKRAFDETFTTGLVSRLIRRKK